MDRGRRLWPAHVLYVLNINALRTLLTSLAVQAHMDLSLFFLSHAPIVVCSVVVFKFNHHIKINVLLPFQKSGFSALKGTLEIILSNLLSNAGILPTASCQVHTPLKDQRQSSSSLYASNCYQILLYFFDPKSVFTK